MPEPRPHAHAQNVTLGELLRFPSQISVVTISCAGHRLSPALPPTSCTTATWPGTE